MKQLSIEQKATRYEEALERAKEQLDKAKVFDYKEEQIAHDIRTTAYAIFPELKESEDGRIRKELIEFVKSRGGFKQEYIAWLEKQGEQKPAEWTAEDEEELDIAIKTLEEAGQYSSANWLKNVCLVPRPKQEWSEEKEKDLFNAAKHLREYAERCVQGEYSKIEIFSLADRIESFRPQNTWKPSDEQIDCLSKHIEYERRWNTSHALNVLSELLEQLKNLK